MMKLHPTQKKLLQLLEKHQDEPLTVREIQDRLDLSSTSLVAHHIEQLEKKGWIKRNLYNPQDYHLLKSPEKPVVFLNLYGLAQCGPEGSVLDGNPIDRIGVSTKHRSISGPVEFEVTVRKTFKGEGGIKVYVVSGGVQSKNENIATIKFNISSKSKSESGVVKRKPPRKRLHV
jgi:biotin operon repressor